MSKIITKDFEIVQYVNREMSSSEHIKYIMNAINSKLTGTGIVADEKLTFGEVIGLSTEMMSYICAFKNDVCYGIYNVPYKSIVETIVPDEKLPNSQTNTAIDVNNSSEVFGTQHKQDNSDVVNFEILYIVILVLIVIVIVLIIAIIILAVRRSKDK